MILPKLTRSFGPYDPERPTDEFEVEFNGERYRVQRRDIEKASASDHVSSDKD